MTPRVDEKIIQKNTIELLKNIGYNYISVEDLKLYRANNSQVVLKDILREQLQKLNSFEYKGITYPFSAKNISKAIDDLDIALNEGLIRANQKITDQLLLGNSYSEELQDGVTKSFSLKYIDFDNPKNNIFHVCEEFVVNRVTTNETIKSRRPDITLFINGIPFAVIELKRSAISYEEGISQMIRNQGEKEIPNLFKYIQITLAGNNHSPHYATVGTPKKFYAVWKEDDMNLSRFISGRTVSPLDKTIYALFDQTRFIELLHSFIIFDALVKKIARYQQFFAIQKVLDRVKKIDSIGRRVGGLIWHTQGSGKSLTMVMLARVLKKEITGSKIIVVTDRKDLDSQIHEVFNDAEIKAKRAKSGRDLVELLKSGKSVITTLVHKFEKVKNEHVTFNDPDTFILVDESHRTQGGDLHKAMKKVFPEACYIGFTGTPLMKSEKNSFVKFGGEIHRYTIDQAVEDRAVLPLLYEGRVVDQWINDKNGLDKRFEKIARYLEEDQVRDLKRKWAKFRHVASSERRLEMIMLDIDADIQKRLQGTNFKAMLAANSKYEAIKYHKLFEEMSDIKTAFVISAPDSREGYSEVDEENRAFIQEEWQRLMKIHGDEDRYLDKIKDKFINSDDIKLLIVVSKLLTGFDAPRASVLYIDKPLKDHNLLQAIARVNRLYEGKDFGFIVDYRGLLGDLDKALNDYSGLAGFDVDDIKGAVFDIKDEIAKVKTFYTNLKELFLEVKNQDDQESYEVFLVDEDKRKLFYSYLSNYARALNLALSSDKIEEVFSNKEIENYKAKMRFYASLRKSVRIRYHESIDFGKYEKQMQKLLDTFISADEVNQLTKLVNIFDEEFENELKRVEGNNARADMILSAVSAVISEKKESNPAYYDKLSKKIEEIIQEYKAKRLTEEEKLEQAKELRDILLKNVEVKDFSYPKSIKNSSQARAFYDNLEEHFTKAFGAILQNSDLLAQSVLKITDIFQEATKKPDWKNNSIVRDKIEGQLDDIFWDLEDEYGIKFENIDEIVTTIKQIGINNY